MATEQQDKVVKQVSDYKYGFNVESKPVFKSAKGLTREIVEEISKIKKISNTEDHSKLSQTPVLKQVLLRSLV